MGNTTLMDYLNDIARAVQSKTGTTKKIKLKDLADEIDNIDSLDTHKFANDATHPLTINSNGNYNIYDNDFSHIVVDIPFAGDDLAPYFQNQTGSGPYKMVFYNHTLQKPVISESEEASEVGYSSYDFTVGDGGVAFLTYDYNSSSQVYADHSVSFHKHNLSIGEIIARENYHLTNPDYEWNDNKYSDVTIVDLDTGNGTYPVVYYNSSGYLAKDDNVATPGYVSWRNSTSDSFYSTNLSTGDIVYSYYGTITHTNLSANSSYVRVAYRNGTDSNANIKIESLRKGNMLYNNDGEIDIEDSQNWAAYRNGDYVNTLDSTSDIIYYNSSNNRYSDLDIKGCVIYPGANGVVAEDIHEGAGLYANIGSTSGFEIYRQELSDASNSARILIGATYESHRYDVYKCLPSNVLYFTVSSSGQTYVNTLNLESTINSKVCNIVLPHYSDGSAYSITYPSDFTRSYNSFNGLSYGQSDARVSNYSASVETLNNRQVAYVNAYNSSGVRAYGDITSLYPSDQYNNDALSVTTPTKTNLSAMYVAYYSPQKGLIDFGQIYGDDGSGNNVLKAYHLGTDANDKYCVVSTNLSYSFSDNDNGYTNNFITVLYPHIADYSNDSTKEKASIGNLTVTPNRYYKLKPGNEFDSIGSVDITPIKLVAEDITYNWTAPVESEAPAEAPAEENPKVFGYIRIYQTGNGYSVDSPVTYEMITVLANAGLINTNYVVEE